ncbi:Imm32 family immunity protein [Roseivirga misakiensis]|nr:hypothetical protein [Roseivirga misakiensis]
MKIQVPDYKPESGITLRWEGDFQIETRINDGTIVIKANRDGLISMANHLLNLSQDKISCGYHIHYDSFSELEEGSCELIIEKS